MSHTQPRLPRLLLWPLLLAWLIALPALGASLKPEKTEINVGETVFVKLDADLALMADWSASPELTILNSSDKGATVKGVKAGKAKLTVKYLGGKKSTQIMVLAAASEFTPIPPSTVLPVPATPTVPRYQQAPLSELGASQPAAGEIRYAMDSTINPSGQQDVFNALSNLAASDRPTDLAQAREFFRMVQSASGPNGNVWNTLRAVKRANKSRWDAVQGVENQLVSLVRDTLVSGRKNVLQSGNLGTVFAFLDSGKWRNRAVGDLYFDTDFDTTFFADRLVEVDPDSRDTVISRVEDMLAQQLGVGSKHLGIELTGFGYEAQGDNYVSKSGIKWALRESASHIHLIDPATGRIGANIAQHPNVLFARQQEAALRLRHPELFDSNGRLLPNITRAEVQRRLQAEAGLSRSERMFSEGARMNVTDAALAPIDMACHLSETQQSTNPAENIAKISKQVARSTAVFIEGMGGGEAGQRSFTPAELEFMRLTRQLETAKIERAAAEAQVARFMTENPAGSAYSEAQIAELDRLLEQARTQKALVERTLTDMQGRWSVEGVRSTALTVLKKQARAGFDASLRDLIGRPAAERTRGLGDFAREMEVLSRHYESKGAPAEILQWARQGLETSLVLHEMSRDARFGELWTAFERIGRAGPTEITRLKEFLKGSEAGRRLLARVGVALDNIVNPPKELTLGHPMAEASRSLREITGSYTALVGHTALLVGLVDAAYQAKTNEEFAVSVAHTLVGTTTVGLILQEGQQFVFGGDNMAGTRLISYLLIPETMLPALVEALGHSTINLGSAIAFDTQLDALYLVSKFDNGALTQISGYPRGKMAEMLADILGIDGYRTLENMIKTAVSDKDPLLADQAKMVDQNMKRVVVSALNKTFMLGTQMVFKDDATLSAIVGNVNKYHQEITYLTKTFGIEIPLGNTPLGPTEFTATAADFYPGAHNPLTLTALALEDTKKLSPHTPHWASSLDRGQLRALAQLFVTRDWWGNEARKAFIATLIRTLEERHRAEQDVDANLREQKRKELMERFAELDITDPGTVAYNQEAGYHLAKHIWNVTLGFATTRERAVHEMKALNRYLDVYNHVRDLRFAIDAEVARRTGRSAIPRPLTTPPALTAVPAIDYPAADSLARDVSNLGEALSRTLNLIKGSELESEYDRTMFKRIYEAQYLNAYWSEAGKSTAALKQQVAAWKLVAKYDLDALREDCSKQSSTAWKLSEDLITEFRNYYANQAMQAEIRINPIDLTEGDRFTATLVLSKGKLPKSAKWLWQANGGIEVTGAGNTASGIAKGSGQVQAKLVDTNGKTLADISASIKTKPIANKDTGDLTEFITAALKSRDWKRLAERLDTEKKNDLKRQNVVAWQARIDALNKALGTLKDERMNWALAWEGYIEALNSIDSSVWDKLTRQVDTKRAEVEERCWRDSSASENSKKRTERCQTEGRKFEESCVSTWPDQHWEEMKRIRMAKQELPDAVQTLHSAAYFSHRAWFEAVEKLTEKYKLPFPYPKPVTPRLKYALSCANVDLPPGKKIQDAPSAFKVTVEAPSASLPFGKAVTLNVSASGGKSPYSFSWSSGGSGSRVTVTPRWAGEWTVTVTATDADGKTGEGSATLRVTAAQVKLQGTQPTVFYGSTATLSLPGKEPPTPAHDPCAGRGNTASNPFDECIQIDPSKIKSVTTAPQGPGVIILDKPGADPDATVKPIPSTGKQRVYWQPTPEIIFNPTTSDNGQTKVTYNKMGQVKLWCEIQEEIEGAFHTVGECDQETVNVIAPKFSVSFTPPEGQGRIGQDIRLRIDSQPGVANELINFRWLAPGTYNLQELANAREITFKVKDAKPVVLKALARVPGDGDEIAEINATYTGQIFEVKAWAVEPGTRPMMWDAKKGGLVPVPKDSYATHERIPLRAEIQGGGAPDGIRWNWTVNEDTTISNPISQTPTVSRSSAGGINAHVEARDGEGALLGSGDVSVSVIEVRDSPPPPINPTPTLSPDKTTLERGQTVSINAEVNGGKPPYSYAWQGTSGQGARVTATPNKVGQHTVRLTVTDSKGKSGSASLTLEVQANQADRNKAEATRLGDQARKQLQQGDLPGAVSTARNSTKLDPVAAAAASKEIAAAAKKAGWNKVYERDFNQALSNLEAAHELDPADKDASDKLEQARHFAKMWPQVEAKAREFDAQIAEKKVWTAQKTMLEMQDLQHEMSGGMANPLSKRVTDAFNNATQEYNHFMQDVKARHTRYFEEKNWQAMLDNAQEALKREHVLANEKELNSNIAFAKQMLREQETKYAAVTLEGKWKASEGDWSVVETTPGMYRLDQSTGQVKIARQGNNPGGLQHAGLRLNRGLPASGDFDAQVSFSDARIEGGLNQIELHATFADGSYFFVVRDREGSGSHIWAPGLQGNQPCGRAGTLRMERRGETVTGYCDGKVIWSAPRKAPLTGLQFVLQNNGSNDPISATFRDWRFNAAAGNTQPTSASGLAGTWTINANSYTGKVEFNESGGKLSGRVWFDAHQVWEDLRDISFDGRTLRFLRPGPSQHYTGTLSVNEVRGTFDGGGSWNWFITRVSGGSTIQPLPPEDGSRPANSKLVLEDDKGPYQWIEGTEVQTQQIHAGRAAFRSTGNNHFTHRLGIVGNYADQYRYLDFWIYLKTPSADIQLQAQVDGAWGKRWGFDGDATYNGYGWAMEGTTAGLPSGRWLHQRIDLMQQLHINAGQTLTGLAFSSDGGDVYYDSVYLIPGGAATPLPQVTLSGKRVLEDDAGPYSWVEPTSVQKEVVANGKAAFRSTGNNHFAGANLGVVGDYPEQFRSLNFWLFPIGAEADLQLQVQVDGVWGKRWGFDAGPKYNGYGWTMEGTTTGLKPGQWQEVSVDLLNQLHINPGQKITGLAFSSDNGDVYYDSVYLRPNPNPARKPSFQPAGRLVLEDSADTHKWVEPTEVENYLVFNGAKAFRSTGNNHFLADLGVAGSGNGQFRFLNFWAFFMGSEADIQVQVQVNGTWGKRWGYDAGPVYNGYGWAMEGTSTRLTNGRWVQIQLDLINQLHLKSGDKITGLAFSSDNADVIYDSVYLLPVGVTPDVGGGYQGGESGGRDYTSMSPASQGNPPPVVSGNASSHLNLARGKPASQSSRSQWSRPDDPQGAVDGVINGSYAFHTNNEANPWWQVDLGAAYRLSEVRIYNRLDSSSERARTLQVMLSDDGRKWRTAYRHNGAIFGGKDGKPLVVSLPGEQARYVRLQLNESNWFHLDEVEVMGASDATPSNGGRDYSGYSPQPTSSAPAAGTASLLEQVDALKGSWKELKGLFGK